MRLNFNDNAQRREWEKKWEIIKIISAEFSTAVNPQKPTGTEELAIPIKKFFIGIVKDIFDIEKNINYFKSQECFNFLKGELNFVFSNIDGNTLETIYKQTEQTNKKFSNIYQNKKPEVLYWVSCHLDGSIILNDKYLIKGKLGLTNTDIFQYLIDTGKGKRIKRDEIEKNVLQGEKLKRELHTLINDFGFKNELKKAFFPRATNDLIVFINNLNKEDLKKHLVNTDKLADEIKKLKIYRENSNKLRVATS